MIDILHMLADMVRIHDPRVACTNAQDPEFPILRVIVCDIGYVVAGTAWFRVVPFLALDGIQVWSHDGLVASC
jgi:hypothetical protein